MYKEITNSTKTKEERSCYDSKVNQIQKKKTDSIL